MSWIKVKDKTGEEHVVTEAQYEQLYKRQGFTIVEEPKGAKGKGKKQEKPSSPEEQKKQGTPQSEETKPESTTPDETPQDEESETEENPAGK